ncbi:PglY protein [Streptosporangium sp. NPDC002524]|uniref:PglY protein n=1 Tax=Streptosporangium sp. NPDC002524 TaxID=3154537 RepID=UPI0033265539
MSRLLRDVIDIPQRVDPGDLVMDITATFDATGQAVRDYVVTDQLYEKLDEALELIHTAVQTPKSLAAYLHGSFGSGKSHFMTILHAVLNREQAAEDKPRLRPLVAKHQAWIQNRRFLLVPFHLVGAESLDAAILSGYVKRVRELHPEAPTPPVYRDDHLLANGAMLRERMGDQAFIAALPGRAADEDDWDDDAPATEPSVARTPWTGAELDAAFRAAPGDPLRGELISALLDSLLSAYGGSVHGDRTAFVPLETGLAEISRHAKSLGYDAVVLFLDELILWLNGHLANLEFVTTEANKLVKLVESGDAGRPVPIVSFIARQRDIAELVGKEVAGADVVSLEDTIKYLERSFSTITLADNNLPDIAQERVLKPKDDAARRVLDEAFAQLPRDRSEVWDTLLDASGLTHADAGAFRKFYPFSPALINTLIAISGALQRERTGLKVLREMLVARRDDLEVGQLIPLGDLWDILSDGAVQPFSNRLKHEFEAAKEFYDKKVRPFLLQTHGLTAASLRGLDHQHPYRMDDRLIKTLLLAALAPDVPAIKKLTAGKVAALNYGSIRTRVEGMEPSKVVERLKQLSGQFGEIRYTKDSDTPVFSLHLTGINIDAILSELPANVDTEGNRQILVRDLLWSEFDVADRESFNPHIDVVWRGTKRTVGLVFGNIRDSGSLSDTQFDTDSPEEARIVFDFPFDTGTHGPHEDLSRIGELQQRGKNGPVICWLPSFITDQRRDDLGRLLKLRFLLGNERRINEYASGLSSADRQKARNQIEWLRDSLTSELKGVLKQAYGTWQPMPANIGTEIEEHVVCMDATHRPRLHVGHSFSDALLYLTDNLFNHLYPKHPDFDPQNKTRTAIRAAELRTVLDVITVVAAEGGRAEVERGSRKVMSKIAHPLRLGEMQQEAFFQLGTEWRDRINQRAGNLPVLDVKDLLAWLEETELRGADRMVRNLVVVQYALTDNRVWIRHGTRVTAPTLDGIDTTYSLRAQELPSRDDFETALTRAQHLFAVPTRNVYSAPNVARLASAVRDSAGRLADPATGLVRALEKRAPELGLDTEAREGRLVTARAAADLLARIGRLDEPTPLIRFLAGESLPASDDTVGTSMAQAEAVRRALEDETDWTLIDDLRELSKREGDIGAEARRVLGGLVDIAGADESVGSSLPPVLKNVRASAISLLREASNTTVRPGPVTTTSGSPSATPGGTSPQGQGPTSADQVPIIVESEDTGLADDGRPGGAARRGGGTRRVRAAKLDDLVAELRRMYADWPDAEVEISWRLVSGE